MALHPLPFQLNQVGSDSVDLTKVETVKYRAEGLLHLVDWGLILEWSTIRTTQLVSMMGEVKTEVEELPKETVEVPFEDVASARMISWWRPHFELRVKGLDLLRKVPGVQGVTVRLRIERRDRSLARAYVIEINEQARAAELDELPPGS